jgi:hypothetical protein
MEQSDKNTDSIILILGQGPRKRKLQLLPQSEESRGIPEN